MVDYELTYESLTSGNIKIYPRDLDTNINVIAAKLDDSLDFYYIIYLDIDSKKIRKTNDHYKFYNISIGSLKMVETIDRKEKLKNLLLY